MQPIAIRLVLIISMLMSFQAAAGMFMEPTVKGACADMAMQMPTDAATKSPSSDKTTSDQQHCGASCCMAFTAISTPAVMPVVKVTAGFQKTAIQSPSRFTHINYRPPILS